MCKSPNSRQYLTAFIVSLAFFYSGCVYGWIPASLVRMLEEKCLTVDESSWALSLVHIGSLISALPSGAISGKLGRKPILLASAPIFALCWLLTLSTLAVPALLTFRIIQGMAMGMVFSTGPLYIGEISRPEIRGRLGLYSGATFSLGLGVQYGLAAFRNFNVFVWANLPFPIIFFMWFIWIPETPYCLLMMGEEEKAVKSLAWFRGKSKEEEEVVEEVRRIRESVEKEGEEGKGKWKSLFFKVEGRKALLLVLLIVGTLVLGGGRPIPVFAGLTIAQTYSPNETLSNSWGVLGPVIVSLVSSSGPFLVGSSVDRLGRRPILISSSIGAALACLAVAIYFRLQPDPLQSSPRISWIPSAALLIASFLQGLIGAILIPLRAELFQSNTRGIASGIVVSTSTILSFIIVKVFSLISETVGIYLNFVLYSVVGIFGSIGIYVFLPETKKKTFDEIQELLRKRHVIRHSIT